MVLVLSSTPVVNSHC